VRRLLKAKEVERVISPLSLGATHTVSADQLSTIAIWVLIFIPIWGTILGIILWRRHKKKGT